METAWPRTNERARVSERAHASQRFGNDGVTYTWAEQAYTIWMVEHTMRAANVSDGTQEAFRIVIE